MTYATGQIISNGDYNTFATGSANGVANNAVANVNTIWGVGNGNKGYGQTNVLSPVTTGTLVTAAQWSSMFSKITSVANHQGTSITALTNPVTGNLIQAKSALSGNINSINNRVGNVSGYATGAQGSVSFSGANNNRWNNALTFTITVTFASGDAARYFFNAGGVIALAPFHSSFTSNNKNTSWTNLTAACGTIIFGYNTTTASGNTAGGTGTVTPPVALGYWQSTTTSQGIQLQYATGAAPYANTNYIATQVKTNGHQGTNGDVGSVLTFTVFWEDPASPTWGAPTDIVDGTSSMFWTVELPITTYLSNTWGNPTVSGSVTGS